MKVLLTQETVKQIIDLVPKRTEVMSGYTPSAILMLFFNRAEETHLVYIRRTKRMKLHSGNMAFPGGKIDPEDKSSYATAVRETFEEIGVSHEKFLYLGEMGFFETLTSRFDAVAHLGWCDAPPAYCISEVEVDEVVEIPLENLRRQFRADLDFSNHEEVMYLSFRYQSESSSNPANLWGLTARITHHFLQGLQDYFTEL